MLKIGELLFDNKDIKLAKKVAKLNETAIEEANLLDDMKLVVEVSLKAVVNDRGESTFDHNKLSYKAVEGESNKDFIKCADDNSVPYDVWIGKDLWRSKSPMNVTLTTYIPFHSFTKKKAKEFLTKDMIAHQLKQWAKSRHNNVEES